MREVVTKMAPLRDEVIKEASQMMFLHIEDAMLQAKLESAFRLGAEWARDKATLTVDLLG